MADRDTARKDGITLGIKVAAATSIDAGKLVAINATGFGVPASDAAGLKVVGVAQETIDNSAGGNGDKSVLIMRKKAFHLANAATNAVAAAHIMTNVYVKDTATVSSNGGTNSIVAGLCIEVDGAGVWVEI